MRNLIDLAFVAQDYEMVLKCSDLPIKDFKSIKALMHMTHCEELNMYAKMIFDRNYLTRDFKEFIAKASTLFMQYQTVGSY